MMCNNVTLSHLHKLIITKVNLYLYSFCLILMSHDRLTREEKQREDRRMENQSHWILVLNLNCILGLNYLSLQGATVTKLLNTYLLFT